MSLAGVTAAAAVLVGVGTIKVTGAISRMLSPEDEDYYYYYPIKRKSAITHDPTPYLDVRDFPWYGGPPAAMKAMNEKRIPDEEYPTSDYQQSKF